MDLTTGDTEQQAARAPGCFGAATVYAVDSEVCQRCVAYTACGEASMKNLEALRGVIDVSDIMARHAAARQKMYGSKPKAEVAKAEAAVPETSQPPALDIKVARKTNVVKVQFELSPDQLHVIALIGNVKVKEQAIVLCKQNKLAGAVASMHKGINPFAVGGPQFLRVMCDMLLSGGFTKTSLKARLMSELGWKEGTAGSHVSIGWQLLFAFKVIQANGDTFTLSPASV